MKKIKVLALILISFIVTFYLASCNDEESTVFYEDGLVFVLSDDEQYYSVGMAEGEQRVFNIPEEFNGKPVSRIMSNGFYKGSLTV